MNQYSIIITTSKSVTQLIEPGRSWRLQKAIGSQGTTERKNRPLSNRNSKLPRSKLQAPAEASQGQAAASVACRSVKARITSRMKLEEVGGILERKVGWKRNA